MTIGTQGTPDRPQSGDQPHYTFEIDPHAIHAGILRAHEERHRAVIALLVGAAHGVYRICGWIGRLVTRAVGGHGSPGALAR